MGTLSSYTQRRAQSMAIITSWEVISVEQLISVRLGIGKEAKVSCRQLINPHTLSKSHLKEQGSGWMQRMLKKAEGLQVTSVFWPLLPAGSGHHTGVVGVLCSWFTQDDQPRATIAQPHNRKAEVGWWEHQASAADQQLPNKSKAANEVWGCARNSKQQFKNSKRRCWIQMYLQHSS